MKKNIILMLVGTFLLSACASTEPHLGKMDVFESYNRKMFAFNYQVDKYLLKPIAKGYIMLTTQGVRARVTAVFNNVLEPVSAINHLLQGEIQPAGVNLTRFVVNTTVGVVGLFDVASEFGMEPDKTGFDETLARWCIADGPYIILPFLGPATPRSTVGKVVDSATNPVRIASHSVSSEGSANTLYYSYVGTSVVSSRANVMSMLDSLEEGSIDFYAAMRSAFLQNRSKNECYIKSSGKQSYDFDFGMEDEFETYDEMEQK